MGATDPVKPLILFDGVCNLCNGSVLFIIRRDRNAKFQFAALQSSFGQSQLFQFDLPQNELNTIILIKEGKLLVKSDAALEIARNLDGIWPLFYTFKIVPAFFRNWIYELVAKNRYHWFGRQEACIIPTPDLKARFLE